MQARSSVLRYMYPTVSIFDVKYCVQAAVHSRMYAFNPYPANVENMVS